MESFERELFTDIGVRIERKNMKYLLIGYSGDISYVLNTMCEHSIETQSVFWVNTVEMTNLIIKIAPKYEKIIIALRNPNEVKYIYDKLKENAIEIEKIIPFYQYFYTKVPVMICDRRMQNPLIKEYMGIILGISHAEVGILSEKLKYPTANLAVSSQDIYYNYKTLEYCIQNYPEKIRNIRYALIDMFDYTYFNYDASLSRGVSRYYSWGGYRNDAHNFSRNKSYSLSFEEMLSIINQDNRDMLTDNKIEFCNNTFQNIVEKMDYRVYYEDLDIQDRKQEYSANTRRLEVLKNRTIAKKVYEETICENEDIFNRILDLLLKVNPKMKIYTIIMPRFHEVYEYCEEELKIWKDYFYERMEESMQKYNIKFYDFSEHELGTYPELYQDESHFNYKGAGIFTEFINDNILPSDI